MMWVLSPNQGPAAICVRCPARCAWKRSMSAGPKLPGSSCMEQNAPLRAQPVQSAGVRLDPALDDATGLGQDGAARGEHLVRLGEHLGGEELIDGSAGDRGVELSQPELLVQP